MARRTSGVGAWGFDELEKNLAALGEEVATKVGQTANRRAAKIIENALRAASPDGPRGEGEKVGNRTHTKIKNNIKTKKGRSKEDQAVVNLVHTGRAFHALFYERGTIHQPARPTFVPAFEAAAPQALKAIENELEKGIARAARKGKK